MHFKTLSLAHLQAYLACLDRPQTEKFWLCPLQILTLLTNVTTLACNRLVPCLSVTVKDQHDSIHWHLEIINSASKALQYYYFLVAPTGSEQKISDIVTPTNCTEFVRIVQGICR